MLTLEKKITGERLFYSFDKVMGSIATENAKKEILSCIDSVNYFVFDLRKTEFITSAFLNLLLTIAKNKGRDKLSIINATAPSVKDVFRISGFKNILNIS